MTMPPFAHTPAEGPTTHDTVSSEPGDVSRTGMSHHLPQRPRCVSFNTNPHRPASRRWKQKQVPQLVFLDLDNTLIPTAWMMDQWKLAEGLPAVTLTSINHRLEKSGLFTALDRFFADLVSLKAPHRIVIVTNAAIKTVESFYLTHCLPQLGDLISKYKIPIRSTQCWVDRCGPVPPAYQGTEFREYYTTVKFLQFEEELTRFVTQMRLQRTSGNVPIPKSRSQRSTALDRPLTIDVTSVGDQLCEITAAIRLGAANPALVRHTKLVMLLDALFGGFERSAAVVPEVFVQKLAATRSAVCDVVISTTVTTMRSPATNPVAHVPECPNVGQGSRVCCDHSTEIEENEEEPPVCDHMHHRRTQSDGFLCNSDHQNVEHDAAQQPCFGIGTPTPSATDHTAVWIAPSKDLAYCVGLSRHFDVAESCPTVICYRPDEQVGPTILGTSTPCEPSDDDAKEHPATPPPVSNTTVVSMDPINRISAPSDHEKKRGEHAVSYCRCCCEDVDATTAWPPPGLTDRRTSSSDWSSRKPTNNLLKGEDESSTCVEETLSHNTSSTGSSDESAEQTLSTLLPQPIPSEEKRHQRPHRRGGGGARRRRGPVRRRPHEGETPLLQWS